MISRFAIAAAAVALHAVPVAAAKTAENVYALCTVRDVTVQNNRMKGKVYRSSIFSAPASYDTLISLKPEKGGAVSSEFEKWVAATHGLRSDRMSLTAGDEHYCIETPLTLEGKEQLTKIATDWDRSNFPEVELVRTSWTRKRSAADERFDADLAKYEASLQATRAAAEKYERDLAEIETKKARDSQAAKAALDRFASERSAHEAETARMAAENERRQQAYREEYKRVTGRYPD